MPWLTVAPGQVAVSGAPVTNWEAYDTAYTERYMALDCPAAYAAGSVLALAPRFPDEPNRLLLVHGLSDENVHFHHSAMLLDALVAAGKPYSLLVRYRTARGRVFFVRRNSPLTYGFRFVEPPIKLYPSERHGLRGPAASEHFEANLFLFLLQHL